MKRHGEFDRAEVAGQVAAGLAHAVQDVLTQFVAQQAQFGPRQASQVGWAVNGREEVVGHVAFEVRSRRPSS
jgi:hypothetical protein